MNVARFATIAVLGLIAPSFGCASPPVSRAFAPRALVRAPLEVAPREMGPAKDYRVGPHDILTLRVFELEKPGEVASLELEVSSEGQIAVPYIGLVPAAGSTVTSLRRTIADALGARFLVDPQVVLGVKEYRSRMIAVMGSVARPGVFYLNRNRVSLVDALSLAGGLSKEAGTRAVVVRPKSAERAPGSESTPVDLYAAIVGGDPAHDIDIEPGAVIQVPAAEEFFVMGYVNKPGAFPYQRPVTVLQAIAIAGGLDARHASPSVVKIKRESAEGVVEVVQVDLDAIASGKDPDVAIRPGDSIEAGRTVLRAVVTDVLDSIKGVFGIGISAGAL